MFRSILLLPFILFFLSCGKHINNLPCDEFKEGDVVFRKGRGVLSQMVRLGGGGDVEYTHVGIMVCVNSQWSIVHAVRGEREVDEKEDVVKVESVESFFSTARASNGELCHVVCHDYILRGVRNKALAIVENKVLFDSSFDDSDTIRLYCCELVKFVYEKFNVDLVEGRYTKLSFPTLPDSCIFPSDIKKSNKLRSYYKF